MGKSRLTTCWHFFSPFGILRFCCCCLPVVELIDDMEDDLKKCPFVLIARKSDARVYLTNGIYVGQRVVDFLNTAALILSTHCSQASIKNCSATSLCRLFLVCFPVFVVCLCLPLPLTPLTSPYCPFIHKAPSKMWSRSTLGFSRSKPNRIKSLSIFDTVKYFSPHETLFLWTL